MDTPLQVIAPRKGKSSAERQREFRERKAALGLVNVTVLVRNDVAAQIQVIAAMLADNPHLEIATLRDKRTGKLVSFGG